MKVELIFNAKRYQANLLNPIDISLPLREGSNNPNCYWAEPIIFETIISTNFIGSVRAGGSVNYQRLMLTPHGNGTHTECYGHISADGATINQHLKKFHFLAEVITVEPVANPEHDFVITQEMLLSKIKFSNTEALIIRTLPNDAAKKTKQYSGTNPPYFQADAISLLVSRGIKHLLTDLPSVDREVDAGKLTAHKVFWGFPDSVREACTITELIYVDTSIQDDLYLLNLQFISLEMDASPSKPVLYKLTEVL